MKKRKYTTGLLIGRFQPFHKGHLYLVKKALRLVDKLIIGIGSSNVKDRQNPLTFPMRKKMIGIVFEKEGIKDRLLKIAPIPDVLDDDKWLRLVRKKVGRFDVAVGNNEWTNGIFERTGVRVLRVPFYKRHLYEGRKIRELIEGGESLGELIPPYLEEFLPT